MSRLRELKIKIKSLAEEARIIRAEEKRLPGDSYDRRRMREHRVHEVRNEARSALLAYGFLRGRLYVQLESNPHWRREPCSRPEPDWVRVAEMARRFGNKTIEMASMRDALLLWRDASDEYADAKVA